jgi:Amt family ammonium transporter
MCFVVGYSVAYGTGFFVGAEQLAAKITGEELHELAGAVVVHPMGGWITQPAVIMLGERYNRNRKDGQVSAHLPSSIPFLALGAWILIVGWFGFNVMSAQTLGFQAWLRSIHS